MRDGTSKVLTIDDHYHSSDRGATQVAISPDGRYVAVGGFNAVVRVWEMSTGVLVQKLRGHMDGAYSVAFTPDGKGLVSGSLDKTLKYWDVSQLGIQSGAGSQRKGRGEKTPGSDSPVSSAH